MRVTGVTNADLTQAGFTNILTAINALGVTANNTEDGLIVVNGASQSAIFIYIESEGGGNTAVTAGELTLLAVSNGLLTTGNFELA